MRKHILLTCCAVFTALFTLAQTAEEYFKPVKYRNIGPFRGGRSVTASGVINNPLTYYMGTTGGGLWKTTDAGQRWENISDGYFKTGSVGAIAVSESHPHIIYCGMGEHAPRGVQTSYGDGVYKSVDAGKTWEKIGLEKTQHISRIVIHPENPDVVFVAAQGALYGPNTERGIYKSTDGGKSWRKVHYVNDLTGCSELSMDMNYPNILYAGMWHHQRKPWKVISGGPGSGVYKSTDDGETWNKIEEGLPEEKGKIAIAVSRANPDKVYLLMESDTEKDQGGLFVSNNGGKNWNMISGDNRLTQRAWYYTEVFADPQDEHTVYVLSAPALRSIDGGNTWERLSGTHGDYHDLWINPNNNKNIVIANDGGAAISFNQGDTWSVQSNMPTAQFYRVNADNLFPYNLYGGQQDNSTVKIANLSFARRMGGISRHDWSASAGGESAFLAFDPDDPKHVMGGSYLGTIEVLDVKANASTSIMAAPIQYLGKAARDMKYLYNWNAPIIWSQHEPGTFYHCAQVVLRTRDMGKTWEEVSPDLTRNIDEKQGKGGGPNTNEAVGAENYGTISYMIESPHEKGVFWTGSDDGLVHITKDGGENWEDVTPKRLQESLINAIDISPHDPATAYIATTRYKFNDYTPAIYKTTNHGQNWQNISAGIPYGAYTRVVREDKDRKGLLYAGTETGIYISWNGGEKWEPLQLNLPVTPITDLMAHLGDLLVATSGRSFWILDDLHLLAQYEKPDNTAKIYVPEDAAYGFWRSPLNQSDTKAFDGSSTYTGINPANGMVIYYDLPKLGDSVEVTMEIKDNNGQLIRSFTSVKDEDYKRYDGGPPPEPTLSKEEGLNRFVWDMRYPTMPGIPNVYIEANYRGHRTSPGVYGINLKYNGKTIKVSGKIIDNPLYDIPTSQYAQYDEIMEDMEQRVTVMHNMVNKLKAAQEQLKRVLKPLKDETLKKEGTSLVRSLDEWDKEMVQRKSKAYDDVENFENKFTAEYMFLINATESSKPSVNQSSIDRKKILDAQWEKLSNRAKEFIESSIPDYNKKLWKEGIGAIQIK